MTFANRLKVIVASTNNKNIIDKKITLHTLRHSIATHLLQHEVKLESTQIYTHLLKTIEDEHI